MAKWLWKQCWDFSALDGPAKFLEGWPFLIIYLAPLPPQKRGYGDEI